MFQISSPKTFLKSTLILDLCLGYFFFLYGICGFLANIYNYILYINGYHGINLFYVTFFFIISIFFLISGLIEMISGIIISKSDYLGIKLTIKGFLISCVAILIVIIYVILFTFITYNYYSINELVDIIFGFSVLIIIFFLIPFLFLFTLHKNRDFLKVRLPSKICYNCRIKLLPPFIICQNCKVRQKKTSDLIKIYEIQNPRYFIRLIIIMNFIFGLSFLIYGIYMIPLIVRNYFLYISGYDYINLIIITITSILFLISGLIEILSGILLSKKNNLGIKLTIRGFTIGCAIIITTITHIVLYLYISNKFETSGWWALIFIMLFFIFILAFLIPILKLLEVYNSKDFLKLYFSGSICYKCGFTLTSPFKFCQNCGIKQKN